MMIGGKRLSVLGLISGIIAVVSFIALASRALDLITWIGIKRTILEDTITYTYIPACILLAVCGLSTLSIRKKELLCILACALILIADVIDFYTLFFHLVNSKENIFLIIYVLAISTSTLSILTLLRVVKTEVPVIVLIVSYFLTRIVATFVYLNFVTNITFAGWAIPFLSLLLFIIERMITPDVKTE